MNEQMEFSETFEGFAKEYGFKDDKEVYTNGSDLIPIFRVKQWLEYDNKLRRIETDTAYECGKHANKWIPVSKENPIKSDYYLATIKESSGEKVVRSVWYDGEWKLNSVVQNVIAWQPLPDYYREESEDK